MAQKFTIDRRDFLRLGAAGGVALAVGNNEALAQAKPQSVAPSDRIALGFIGVGGRGHGLIEAFKQLPEFAIVAASDAYVGRLERARARVGGELDTYKHYQEIIQRDDIDAVVISSPDHWHHQHAVDSLNAGKHAYIEKPMTYSVNEGLDIIAAQKRSGLAVQVGSPNPSVTLIKKARQLIKEGKIGQVTMIRAAVNRNTASGAWIYPIPPDASPETVDWELFLGPAPGRPYSPERFFRWRCYKDYSGGIATDLYVHICTSINYIMDAPMAESVMAMGGLYRWKESRDVPDTVNASLLYPEGFMVNLSGTFNNQRGGAGGMRILGTQGTLAFGGGGLRFIPEIVTESNQWVVESWPEALEEAYYQDPTNRHAEMPATRTPTVLDGEEEYRAEGGNSLIIHIQDWLHAIQTGGSTVEGAMPGHHAAACAHMINHSLDQERVIRWDASAHALAAG